MSDVNKIKVLSEDFGKVFEDYTRTKITGNEQLKNSMESLRTNNVESYDLEEEVTEYKTKAEEITETYTQEELDTLITEYKNGKEQEIKAYQEMLDITGQEIKELESHNFETLYGNYDLWIKEIKNRIENFRLRCTNEQLENIGLTREKLETLNDEELEKILREKDNDLKNLINQVESAKVELDKQLKEKTGYESYEEFKEVLEGYYSDQAILNLAIEKTEESLELCEYTFLTQLENFEENSYLSSDNPLAKIDLLTENQKIAIKNSDAIEALSKVSETNPEYKKIYNYLWNTKGEEAATDYLLKIQNTANQINGYNEAQKFLSSLEEKEDLGDAILNHLKTTGKALEDGIENFSQGVSSWLSDSRVYTEKDYETMYIIEALQDSEKYGKFIVNNYEISQSIGNMLPSIALSAIATPAAGTISMGISAGGNGYHQAMVEGNSIGNSLVYGVLSGLSEACLERVLGGIPGLGSVEVTGLKSFVKAMISEGIEEGSQEYIDALLRYGILNDDIDIAEVNANAKKSAIYGAITAGVMNGTNVAINKVANIVTSKMTESEIKKILKEKGISTENIPIEQLIEENLELLSSELKNKISKEYENIKDPYATEKLENITEKLENVTEKLEDIDPNATEKLENIAEKLENIDTFEEEILNSEEILNMDEIDNSVQLESNLNNLKNEILSLVDSDWSIDKLARKLYIELGKRVNYDAAFAYGDSNTKSSIMSNDISFSTLNSKNVICKGWSQLYYELLVSSGINPNQVQIKSTSKKGHFWVEIQVDSNNIIIADATDAINHTTDLANLKLGLPTIGFFMWDNSIQDLSGVRLSKITNKNILVDHGKSWLNIDQELDYVNGNSYFDESLQQANKLFENSKVFKKLFGEQNFQKNVTEILNADIPENIDGYAAYVYYQKLKQCLIDEAHQSSVKVNVGPININGSIESCATVCIGETTILYSESLGKKIASNFQEYRSIMEEIKNGY